MHLEEAINTQIFKTPNLACAFYLHVQGKDIQWFSISMASRKFDRIPEIVQNSRREAVLYKFSLKLDDLGRLCLSMHIIS